MAITVTATNFSAAYNSKEDIRRHGWQRPLGGMVKLNVDASFRAETRSGATGATIRDKGFFIGATNQIILQVMDVETAEAIAFTTRTTTCSTIAMQSNLNQFCVTPDIFPGPHFSDGLRTRGRPNTSILGDGRIKRQEINWKGDRSE